METPAPIPSPLTNHEKPSVIKPMPKFPYILVAVIVTIASAVLIAWAFFKPVPLQKSQPQETQKQESPLPIDPSNEKVAAVKVTYSFSAATLKEIRNAPEGPQLITSLGGFGINANFVVDKNTKIVFLDQAKKEIPATEKDLKVNQGIRITAEYDLKKRIWVTKKVAIKLEATVSPVATESGNSR